jgi:putative membrane protein
MSALIGWRIRSRRGEAPDTSRARLFSRISVIQAVLVILMVFAATAMARGLFH